MFKNRNEAFEYYLGHSNEGDQSIAKLIYLIKTGVNGIEKKYSEKSNNIIDFTLIINNKSETYSIISNKLVYKGRSLMGDEIDDFLDKLEANYPDAIKIMPRAQKLSNEASVEEQRQNLCQQLLDMARDKKDGIKFMNKKDNDFIFSTIGFNLGIYLINTDSDDIYWSTGNATGQISKLIKMNPVSIELEELKTLVKSLGGVVAPETLPTQNTASASASSWANNYQKPSQGAEKS